MAIIIESLLRSTDFTVNDKNIILRGIVQLAEADGIMDPRERAYLNTFVSEFFPEADPNDTKHSSEKVTKEEVSSLSSDDVKSCFVGFLTITAYSDEDFSDAEKAYMKSLFEGILPDGRVAEIQHLTRKLLYRRVVFSFSLKNRFLHPEFAMEMARRFDISTDEAVEINQGVFSAIMAIKGASEEDLDKATS
jgi:hypothetical protein